MVESENDIKEVIVEIIKDLKCLTSKPRKRILVEIFLNIYIFYSPIIQKYDSMFTIMNLCLQNFSIPFQEGTVSKYKKEYGKQGQIKVETQNRQYLLLN